MKMEYNIHKMCRICLEEGIFTSIYSTEFAMMPVDMIVLCANIKISKIDGLPSVICNNCIYRLSVAYHFKQQCENSDLRLRQFMGLMTRCYSNTRDSETMTDEPWPPVKKDDEELDSTKNIKKIKTVKRSRYKRKADDERKKRGPKPTVKVPQTCYQCHKTFKCAAQLQMHIRTHTGDRPFICTYCPRRFAQKHNLSIHLRVHTGDKPYQCEICSKQFSALGNFQAHKKIHSGIRDQVCPACNKAFITSGDLARHMVTHTGIKNHHCDTCGKAFSRNRDMVAHKKKVHLNENPSEVYKCSECQKVFATISNLNIHIRSHPHLIQQSSMIPPTIAAPTPISIGGIGMLSHSQSTLGMIHTQRLHPY